MPPFLVTGIIILVLERSLILQVFIVQHLHRVTYIIIPIGHVLDEPSTHLDEIIGGINEHHHHGKPLKGVKSPIIEQRFEKVGYGNKS